MICPNCGKYFPHSCGAAMGKRNHGKSSPARRAAGKRNMAKARIAYARQQMKVNVEDAVIEAYLADPERHNPPGEE